MFFAIAALVRTSQRFARQRFNRVRSSRLAVGWRMPVIVVFQVLENVADVQEGVAIQTDIDEGRLHSGKDAGDFAFVDATDQREFFLALDVNLD